MVPLILNTLVLIPNHPKVQPPGDNIQEPESSGNQLPKDRNEQLDDNLSRGTCLKCCNIEHSGVSRKVSKRHISISSKKRSESSDSETSSSDEEDSSPLQKYIHDAKPPRKFKMPQLLTYDETADPKSYIQIYKTIMEIQGAGNTFICRVFPTTLA